MSYFNAAFNKVFLGTKGDQANNPGTAAELSQGFIMEAGINSSELANPAAPFSLGLGTFGFFTKDGWLSVDEAGLAGNACCPLVLASAAIKSEDKEGPFHGGYLESNKSKYIDPTKILDFYRVDPCSPQPMIIHVGNTNFTNTLEFVLTDPGAGYNDGAYTDVPLTGGSGTGATANIVIEGGTIVSLSIADEGDGDYVATDVLAPDTGVVGVPGTPAEITVTAVSITEDCCFEFLCDETYYLNLELKGSPALRFANHNIYRRLDAYTGCCDGPTPEPVNGTNVMIQWADQIVTDEYLKEMIKPIVFDEDGVPWFHTAADAVAAGYDATQIWSNYDQTTAHQDGECAGLRIQGAFVETTFGDCTFQVTDHYEIEPIKILASLVDYTGNPCVFEGICVVTECEGHQGQGFGETALRELILSERYLQNHFHTNLRIREITQGDDTLAAIDRFALYTRYYIKHYVPRRYNPSGTHNDDQYLLEIITAGRSTGFESFMDTWLGNCSGCVTLREEVCNQCTPQDV